MKRYLYDNPQARADFPHIGDRPAEFARELKAYSYSTLMQMLNSERLMWKRDAIAEELRLVAEAGRVLAGRK